MPVKRLLAAGSALTLGIGLMVAAPSVATPSVAAPARCDIPYIANGGSSTVDGTTIAVTAANNTKDGGTIGPSLTNYYWHDVGSGGGAMTTWTFSDPVDELTTDILANADGSVEKYTLDGYAADNTNVLHYEAYNKDELVTHTFATKPLARLELTFTPLSGPYGSVIKLMLTRQGSLCTEPETINASIVPDDKSVSFGSAAPAYTYQVLVNGNPTDLTNAPGWVPPVCTSGYTAGSSPVGTPVTISCSGGAATGYAFNTTATGTLTVTAVGTGVTHQAKREGLIWDDLHVTASLSALPYCTGSPVIVITPNPLTGTGTFTAAPGEYDTIDWILGTYSIQAIYDGDNNCGGSSSIPTEFKLRQAETKVENLTAAEATVGDELKFALKLTAHTQCGNPAYIEVKPSPLTGKGLAEFLPGELDTTGWLAGQYEMRAVYDGDRGCAAAASQWTALRLKPAPVDPEEPEEPVKLSGSLTVYFDALSAKLSAAAKAALRDIPLDATRVKITGYVQGRLPLGNTKTLAKARAKAVSKYLKSLGFTGKLEISIGGIASSTGPKARSAAIKYWYWSS